MHDDYEVCPECTIAKRGWTRQAAFDAYFTTGPLTKVREAQRGMARERIVRTKVVGQADPTEVSVLACGHVVM